MCGLLRQAEETSQTCRKSSSYLVLKYLLKTNLRGSEPTVIRTFERNFGTTNEFERWRNIKPDSCSVRMLKPKGEPGLSGKPNSEYEVHTEGELQFTAGVDESTWDAVLKDVKHKQLALSSFC